MQTIDCTVSQNPFESTSALRLANINEDLALFKTGALQNAIFSSAVFSIIATDEKGIIQLFNAGAERMLGYDPARVINRLSPSDLHDPDEVDERARKLTIELGTPIQSGFEALAFKASRGIEDSYELTYICQDGRRIPAFVSVTALRDDLDQIIGYLMIGSDNSSRKKIELDLIAAKGAAEKANLAKSEFLSSMSHDLRTPLNAILGFAQLMESDVPLPTPSQKSSIDQILQAGWYLLDLINEVLDLALVESGKLSLSLEPMSLAEVMLECQAMIEPQAQGRGISMYFPTFDYPCFVRADRTRIKQVLFNLLSNAIKYNRPLGSVTVACGTHVPGILRVCVTDTGEGLSAEKLEQLFQPFNRLGQENGENEGTGIGLVVTKRLIELMGGAIGVESTVGTGSVFWVDLALADEPQLHPDDADEAPPAYLDISGPKQTVLYVEDNRANLNLVQQLVARRPHLTLLSAVSGELGLEMARSALPDVILMDISLPGISGIEVLRLLRADPRTAAIPVLALSAAAIPVDVERGLRAGFFRYLTKPIKVSEFMEALDIALEHAHSEVAVVAEKERV